LRRALQAEKEEVGLRQQAEAGLEYERKERALGEIGQKLWRSGVLMSQGQFDQAEEMVKDASIPQSGAIFDVLGVNHARWGRLDNAITNFVRAATVQPTNDLGFHALLPLLVQTGRTNEFEQWRGRALAQFRATEDPAIADRMALDCLILPAPAEVTQLALQMLDKNASTPPRPAAELAKGLAEYRQGQFAAAAARLETVVDFQANTNAAVQARLILNMARARLGKANDAPMMSRDQFNLSAPDWNDQMTTELLAREAGKFRSQ
jgi:Tfp pilus assembly protein PilF